MVIAPRSRWAVAVLALLIAALSVVVFWRATPANGGAGAGAQRSADPRNLVRRVTSNDAGKEQGTHLVAERAGNQGVTGVRNQVAQGMGAGVDLGPVVASGRNEGRPVSPVVRMMRITDEADRALLAEGERLNQVAGGQAAGAVAELLALRRSGAGRAELERFIGARLAAPVALRLAVGRWLNAVEPALGTAATSEPVPASFGRGGGRPRVRAIQRRP